MINLILKQENACYYLSYDGISYRCFIGQNGIAEVNQKTEGDKKTPSGDFTFGDIYYRADKNIFNQVELEKLKLNFHVIKLTDLWCDAVDSPLYNQYINAENNPTSLNFSYEKLYREDDLYDLLAVINYNIENIEKGKGSAIFMHCAGINEYTTGCIALELNDLKEIIFNLDSCSFITI